MWKFLFAIVVSTAVIGTSVYLYRHREEMFRPDVRKLGGTRVAFAVEDGTPDEAYFTAMRRRFDPRGRLGVMVRSEGNEVEILVPQGPAHEDMVARVVRLAGRPGKFAFVPIAGTSVDEGVSKQIAMTYGGKRSTPLTTPPTIPLNSLGGREFTASIAGDSPRRYRWVRLGESATTAFQLDPASLAGGNVAERSAVDQAVKAGALLHPSAQPEAMMLPARLPDEGDPAFFVLVRDETDEDAITADQVRSAEGGSDAHDPSQICLRLDGEGYRRMAALQHLRFSMPALKRPTTTWGAGNLVALLIDDRVAAFPQIVTLVRSEAFLRVGPCDEEGDDLISLLRIVPRGVRLSAKPTRIETLEPKR